MGEKRTSFIVFTCTWRPLLENEDLRKWPEQKGFITFKQRNDKCVRKWQDKGVWSRAS